MASTRRKGAKKNPVESDEELFYLKLDKLFTQHLFMFVYEFICTIPLPPEIQQQCDVNPVDVPKSPFSNSMTRAMLLFLEDFTYEDDPCHILSKQFKKKLKGILGSATITYFKFIGNYALMSAAEYIGKFKLNENSPWTFFELNTEHLKETRQRFRTTNFFQILNSVSGELVYEKRDYLVFPPIYHFNVYYDKSRERKFIVDIMQLIFRESHTRLPDYLVELHKKLSDEESTSSAVAVERPNTYFTQETERHLLLVNENVDYVKDAEDVTIDKYCRKLNDKTFNEHDFLEFCVYYTKKALYFFKNANVLPPFKAFFIIVCVFEHGIKQELIFMNNLSSASCRDVQAQAAAASGHSS